MGIRAGHGDTSSHRAGAESISTNKAIHANASPTPAPDPRELAWMQLAIAQAEQAAAEGEVPVGAVVVRAGQVLAVGRNAVIAQQDPTAHAEVQALRAAAQALGNYRLEGCTLYTTLEPCAMCAGALLHARVGEVVFGAADPKAGAAGSVLNVFASSCLNHHTTVRSGLLAQDCGAPLQAFFQSKRQLQRRLAVPLREDALRTPDARFSDLPDGPWPACYVSDLPSVEGLRLHYVDTGEASDSTTVWLCLHGATGWSYNFRPLLAAWKQLGQRALALDWMGFGKSDKPKRAAWHSPAFHQAYVQAWIERLDLRNVVLVVQGVAAPLAAVLPQRLPERIRGVVQLDHWPLPLPLPLPPAGTAEHAAHTAVHHAAQSAPWVDAGYQVGPQVFTRWENGAIPPVQDEATWAVPVLQACAGDAQAVALQAWQVFSRL